MAINLLDVVFLVVVVGFVMWSTMSGAAREIVSLLGLLGGILAAERWQGAVAEWISPMMGNGSMVGLAVSGGFVVAGLLAGALLGGFMESLNGRNQGGFGRMVAAGVGFAKGLAVAMALTWGINSYLPGLQDDLASSLSGPLLMTLLGQLNQLPLI